MNAKKNQGVTLRTLMVSGLVATGTLAMLAVAGPRGADLKVTATVESPKIIAVRVRHDACPICKSLDPQFPKLVQETKSSVLFVTLDLTSETTQKQAALLVGALGLDRAWTGDLSQVGSVSFLNGKTKTLLSFVQTDDMEAIKSSLREAVGALSE